MLSMNVLKAVSFYLRSSSVFTSINRSSLSTFNSSSSSDASSRSRPCSSCFRSASRRRTWFEADAPGLIKLQILWGYKWRFGESGVIVLLNELFGDVNLRGEDGVLLNYKVLLPRFCASFLIAFASICCASLLCCFFSISFHLKCSRMHS